MNTNIDKATFTFDANKTSLNIKVGGQTVNLLDDKFKQGLTTSDGRTISKFTATDGTVVSLKKRDDNKLDVVIRAGANKDLGAFKFNVKDGALSKVRETDQKGSLTRSRLDPAKFRAQTKTFDLRAKERDSEYGLNSYRRTSEVTQLCKGLKDKGLNLSEYGLKRDDLEKLSKSYQDTLQMLIQKGVVQHISTMLKHVANNLGVSNSNEIDHLLEPDKQADFQEGGDGIRKDLSKEVIDLGSGLQKLGIDLSKYKLTLPDLEEIHRLRKSPGDVDLIGGLKRAISQKDNVAIHKYLQMVHDEFEDDGETPTLNTTNAVPQRREPSNEVNLLDPPEKSTENKHFVFKEAPDNNFSNGKNIDLLDLDNTHKPPSQNIDLPSHEEPTKPNLSKDIDIMNLYRTKNIESEFGAELEFNKKETKPEKNIVKELTDLANFHEEVRDKEANRRLKSEQLNKAFESIVDLGKDKK